MWMAELKILSQVYHDSQFTLFTCVDRCVDSIIATQQGASYPEGCGVKKKNVLPGYLGNTNNCKIWVVWGWGPPPNITPTPIHRINAHNTDVTL